MDSGGVPTEFWADPTEILTSFPKEYLGFSGRTQIYRYKFLTTTTRIHLLYDVLGIVVLYCYMI